MKTLFILIGSLFLFCSQTEDVKAGFSRVELQRSVSAKFPHQISDISGVITLDSTTVSFVDYQVRVKLHYSGNYSGKDVSGSVGFIGVPNYLNGTLYMGGFHYSDFYCDSRGISEKFFSDLKVFVVDKTWSYLGWIPLCRCFQVESSWKQKSTLIEKDSFYIILSKCL